MDESHELMHAYKARPGATLSDSPQVLTRQGNSLGLCFILVRCFMCIGRVSKATDWPAPELASRRDAN